MQYGYSPRALALLGCLVLGSLNNAAPVPRRDTVGATKQVTTITADAATNSEVYGVAITSTTAETSGQGSSVSYTADGSASQSEIAAGLVAAIEDDPAFMRFVHSVAQSTNDVVITLKEGVTATFALTSASGDLSQAATTAGASAQAYTFGRAVEVVAGPDTVLGNEGVRPLQVTAGPVSTVTVTTADNGSDSTTVYLYKPFGGLPELKTLTFTSTAAQATTTDAGVAAAEALFPTATVTDNSTNFVIALPAGDELTIATATTNGGTLATSAALTSAGDAVPQCTIVAQDHVDGIVDSYPTSTTPTSTSGRAIPGHDSGLVAVASNDSSYTKGGLAYAETAAGANNGLLYKTPTATTIPVLVGHARTPARWDKVDPSDPAIAHIMLGA